MIAKYPNALCRGGSLRLLLQYLIFSENVSRSHRFLDSAVFVRNKVFSSESWCATTVWISSGALVGGECGSSTRYLSTENLHIRECSRSIERHITETLQASFANCNLNTRCALCARPPLSTGAEVSVSIAISSSHVVKHLCEKRITWVASTYRCKKYELRWKVGAFYCCGE